MQSCSRLFPCPSQEDPLQWPSRRWLLVFQDIPLGGLGWGTERGDTVLLLVCRESSTEHSAQARVRVGSQAYLSTLDPRSTSPGTVTTTDTTAQTAPS